MPLDEMLRQRRTALWQILVLGCTIEPNRFNTFHILSPSTIATEKLPNHGIVLSEVFLMRSSSSKRRGKIGKVVLGSTLWPTIVFLTWLPS